MPISISELAQAREATAQLLEALGLEAYLFEVEPRDGEWEVKVECVIEEGWGTVILPVEKELLLASHKDAIAHQRLLNEWRIKLAACKLRVL